MREGKHYQIFKFAKLPNLGGGRRLGREDGAWGEDGEPIPAEKNRSAGGGVGCFSFTQDASGLPARSFGFGSVARAGDRHFLFAFAQDDGVWKEQAQDDGGFNAASSGAGRLWREGKEQIFVEKNQSAVWRIGYLLFTQDALWLSARSFGFGSVARAGDRHFLFAFAQDDGVWKEQAQDDGGFCGARRFQMEYGNEEESELILGQAQDDGAGEK